MAVAVPDVCAELFECGLSVVHMEESIDFEKRKPYTVFGEETSSDILQARKGRYEQCAAYNMLPVRVWVEVRMNLRRLEKLPHPRKEDLDQAYMDLLLANELLGTRH